MFGICSSTENIAESVYFGLFALQHRGQEGWGVAVHNHGKINCYKKSGLVSESFTDDVFKEFNGSAAIGHLHSGKDAENIHLNFQPLVVNYMQGEIAIVHDGNLTNKKELKLNLAKEGALFQTETDAELLCYLLARHGENPLHLSFQYAMQQLQGSYSILALHNEKLYAVRDPYGNRPLCIGSTHNGYVVASESCALDTIGAEFVRDVMPGEIVVIDKDGLHSFFAEEERKCPAHCIFEYVYLARPDSTIDGINVNKSRRRMGEILAKETGKLDLDLVISVPDSGNTAAIGYADASGHVFSQGILKNRYTGRTFIKPSQAMRERMVNLKLNPIRDEIEGKKIGVVDDSIVRGTTSKRLVQLLRDRGAKEIHFLVSCPPVLYPCPYGIDTAERDKLIATRMTLEDIRDYIGADSLHYLSLDGFFDVVDRKDNYCMACLDGNYKLDHHEENNCGE